MAHHAFDIADRPGQGLRQYIVTAAYDNAYRPGTCVSDMDELSSSLLPIHGSWTPKSLCLMLTRLDCRFSAKSACQWTKEEKMEG